MNMLKEIAKEKKDVENIWTIVWSSFDSIWKVMARNK